MQQTIPIPFSQKTIALFKVNPAQQKKLLYNELLNQQDKIKELLIAYHFAGRERVYEVMINESSILINTNGQGSFMVNYMTGLFNACADVDYNQKAEMKITINIDPESGTALLTGEYIPERGPDEF